MKANETHELPGSGLAMTTLGLGCSQLGGLYRPMQTADASALVDWAWDAGIRYFDTAPFYGYTLSERRVGQSLQMRERERYVLSTKVGRLMRPDDAVRPGDDGWAQPLPFRPQYDYTFDGIMRSYEDSQQRLGMRKIDVLYVHDIGMATHGDAHGHYWQQLTRGGGFRALAELRDSLAVSAIGLGVNEWQVAVDSIQEADLDLVLLAGRYTLLEQEALTPLLDRCVGTDTRVVAAGVFNSGVLAGNGKFNYGDAPPDVAQKVARLAAVCARFDVPLAAAALQFPLAHPAVVSCVVGARSIDQLNRNIEWLETPIPDQLWHALQRDGLLAESAPVPEVCA
ncbi:aldo/keto reductase [Paraburkholderia sp. CNPSo 3157]|uniref:Aldo/keto reductase n=1 Tax=Paraburkholderia franconis TaxID=2654983 RepID=A0A7X1NJK6_9BURK|nr:aldo/keto reductase [Paraburkholderia franconis]MPW22666.1 aldo/keto reductase [Paraburkholderia franconis]